MRSRLVIGTGGIETTEQTDMKNIHGAFMTIIDTTGPPNTMASRTISLETGDLRAMRTRLVIVIGTRNIDTAEQTNMKNIQGASMEDMRGIRMKTMQRKLILAMMKVVPSVVRRSGGPTWKEINMEIIRNILMTTIQVTIFENMMMAAISKATMEVMEGIRTAAMKDAGQRIGFALMKKPIMTAMREAMMGNMEKIHMEIHMAAMEDIVERIGMTPLKDMKETLIAIPIVAIGTKRGTLVLVVTTVVQGRRGSIQKRDLSGADLISMKSLECLRIRTRHRK